MGPDMNEALKHSIETWNRYWGDSFAGWLLIACLIVLIVFSIKERKVLPVVFTGAFSLLLFFLPLTEKLVSLVGEEEVYWRLLWIVPYVIIVSLALTLIISRFRSLKVRIPAVIIMVILIGSAGRGHSASENFVMAENTEQVPQYCIDCADIILSQFRGVYYAATDDLMASYIRTYAPQIIMPYGRNGDGGNTKPKFMQLYQLCSYADYHLDLLPGVAEFAGVDYLIIRVENEDADQIMADAGWIKMGGSDPYTVYRYDRYNPANRPSEK